MDTLFERIASDERVMAVGWCDGAGILQRTSKAWPKRFGCLDARASGRPTFRVENHERGSVLLAAFPISEKDVGLGRLLILHDMSFAAGRSLDARLFLMGFLILLGLA